MIATNTLREEKEEVVNFISETDFSVFKATSIREDLFSDYCSISPILLE